jgi:hypothetical protein
MTPAGCDWPRITTCWIASRLIAMFIAWRTRTSAKRVGALHIVVCQVVGAHVHAEEDHPVLRRGGLRPSPSACRHALKVLHRHVLDEVDLARQQRRDARRGVLDRGDR